MKTAEEIKQEVRSYWDETIQDASEVWELKVRRDAHKKGNVRV